MILINLIRALIFIFKSIFRSCKQQKDEFGLEYYIKEKGFQQTKTYFDDVRVSTYRRTVVKKTT